MTHRWKFFRTGGFEQVRIDTASDLLNLSTLDQKLWVALSCPTRGVEFDVRTLELLDTDGDGHIRAPELLAAIAWAAERLSNTDVLAENPGGLPISAIASEGPGAALLAIARSLLAPGESVITVELASAAEAEQVARSQAAWEEAGKAVRPLGEDTEAAQAAVAALREKINDWFTRCRLAAFDARSEGILNASEEILKSLGETTLHENAAGLAALPLSRVTPGGRLSLAEGINPAWRERIGTLRSAAITPLLGERETLDEADWKELEQKLAPFEAWLASRPTGLPPEAEAVRDLERLTRYVRDLLPFSNNFVTFRDFYTRQGKATFQIGTLYLDGRSAELCVAVEDPARHGLLAGLSRTFLVYCDCTRGTAKRSIAAAFTAGDADQIIVGRNGLFYDRSGLDWDATVTRIVEHPISLRQAFWSPYKRTMRLVGEQFQKIAGSKAKAVEDNLAARVAAGSKQAEAGAVKAGTPMGQQAFDVGKFAGIFAAIGLALGALGTALASALTGVLGMKWWQIPLVIAGLLLVVSGPAVILAWFKLKRRNLGPLLDANGWAVNARASINIPFGKTLTSLARLPDGADRSLTDPYAEKKPSRALYALVTLAIMLLGALWLAMSMHPATSG